MSSTIPHILVIDDNRDILEIVGILLEKHQYQVTGHERMDKVEERITAMAPNLILLDKRLGWADGCDLCRTLKQDDKLQNIPIIMFSAYNNARESCMEAGANHFIEKPFDIANLLSSIQDYIAA